MLSYCDQQLTFSLTDSSASSQYEASPSKSPASRNFSMFFGLGPASGPTSTYTFDSVLSRPRANAPPLLH